MERVKISKLVKTAMPMEVTAVLNDIHEQLAEVNPKELASLHELHYVVVGTQDDGELGITWSIGSDFEDGLPCCFFYDNKWWYRDSWTGNDRPVPGGMKEVVANSMCLILGA